MKVFMADRVGRTRGRMLEKFSQNPLTNELEYANLCDRLVKTN